MTKALTIIVLILIAALAIMWSLWPEPIDENEYIKIGSKEYILLSSKVDTVYVEVEKEIPVYTPGPVTTVEVQVPADVDTTAILQKYFAKNYYADKIELDSIGSVTIKDTISENLLQSREVSYNYRIPTIKETVIVKDKPANEFYLGGGTMIGSSIYAGAMWNNKGKRIYGVQVGAADTNVGFKPSIGASIYFPIKFKK